MSSMRVPVLTLLLLLVACSPTPDAGPESAIDQEAAQHDSKVEAKGDTTVLSFVEQEPGIDPYPSRVLVNRDYLRMDDGSDQSDFTLYDRHKKLIYSVSHENRMALVMSEVKSDAKPPIELKLTEQQVEMTDAPSIEGRAPVHYRMLVNEKLCSESIVVAGLHQDALQALREFRQVMSTIHKGNVDKTPDDMQDPCFLADDVFSYDRTMKYGFPIKIWTQTGYSRLLLDYQYNVAVDENIFRVPEGYLRRSITADQETDI